MSAFLCVPFAIFRSPLRLSFRAQRGICSSLRAPCSLPTHSSTSPSQLQPVPKAIEHMRSPNSRNIPILQYLNSGRSQPRHQPVIIRAAQSRMRLLRRTKLLLDSQMNLHHATRKPTPTTFRKLRRLRQLSHPQHPAIKRASLRLFPVRHRQLHMIDRDERTLHRAILPTLERSSRSQLRAKG